MEKEQTPIPKPESELPYEENEESFGRWFREAAKEKWTNYLKGNERDISIEERDAMRGFLVESGTPEEIQTKLDSFVFNIGACEYLMEEIKNKRPGMYRELRKLGY